MTDKETHLIERALACLKDDHVQNNKHRLGVIGSQDIDSAVEDLEQVLTPEREQKLI